MGGLSEREWNDVLATLPENLETADGWELSLVRRTVERILADRLAARDGGLAARVEALADHFDANENWLAWGVGNRIRRLLDDPASVPDSPPAPHTQAWLNTADPANADKPGRRDSRDEVQGRIDGLGDEPTPIRRIARRSKFPCGNGGEHNPDCFDPDCPFDAPDPDSPPAARRDERGEADPDADIAAGRVTTFTNSDEFLRYVASPDPATRGDSEEG